MLPIRRGGRVWSGESHREQCAAQHRWILDSPVYTCCRLMALTTPKLVLVPVPLILDDSLDYFLISRAIKR